MKEDRSKQVESSISFLDLVLQPPDREQIQFLSTLTGLGPRGRGVEPSGAKGVDSVFQWFNMVQLNFEGTVLGPRFSRSPK